jgi:hypothetical protein
MGMVWESAKGALLKAGKSLEVGEEVKISYGPKGPADYLLDHGFVPEMCQSTSNTGGAVTAELSFEVDDSDRFRDDKLDILEFETYDLAPMEPTQVFDVTGGPGSTGEPDPAMLQFLRLVKLGGKVRPVTVDCLVLCEFHIAYCLSWKGCLFVGVNFQEGGLG